MRIPPASSFASSPSVRCRFWWPAVSAIAILVYGMSLDGLHIPNIGDEAPYIHITRLTAESGDWLPLQAPPGLENTKPPLLFWLGIASTDWGRSWSLLRLRLPILLHTVVIAALAFLLAVRISGDQESGYLAALSFLGFLSTFQYGRPFLTNMPETLFVFLPVFLQMDARPAPQSRWRALVAGLLLGIACLFKSFVLVVPVGLALAWIGLNERRWQIRSFWREDSPGIAITLVVALGVFLLWPALDPDSASVFREFVLGQNLGKLRGEGYIAGLVRGPYPLWRIWLGPFGNAGPLALPLVWLVAASVRGRGHLHDEEKALWIVVLSFLVVYSLPSQRQENYLIPTTPALAVLLGVRWAHIGPRWFKLFTLPLLLALVLLVVLQRTIVASVLAPESYARWELLLPLAAILVGLAIWVLSRASPHLFHLFVFLAFASFTCLMAPFEGPSGRFSEETVARVQDEVVYVPSSFVSRHERYRFLLPGADIRGYSPFNPNYVIRLLESRYFVVVERGLSQTVAGPYRAFGRRFDVKTRHTLREMVRILVERDPDLLFQQELLIRRRRTR